MQQNGSGSQVLNFSDELLLQHSQQPPPSPVLVVFTDGSAASGLMVECNAMGVFLVETKLIENGEVSELPSGSDEVFFPERTVKRVQKTEDLLTVEDLTTMLGVRKSSPKVNPAFKGNVGQQRRADGRPYRF